jgi:hypothetical protein
MPEAPDFEVIATRLIGLPAVLIHADTRAAVIEQLRQVWNARGAADAEVVLKRTIELVAGQVMDAELARYFEETIRALDR